MICVCVRLAARQKAAAGQRRPPRYSSARKFCVLRLACKREVRRLRVLRLPSKTQGASGGHRAAAPPGSSVYCAWHAKGKCGGSVYCAWQAKGGRGPAAVTAPQLRQEALCTAPGTQKGSVEALYTAPARQKAGAGQRRPPRRSSARKLCVLRLARKREVRRLCVLRLPTRQPPASGGHRAAAPPGSSVYCACHAKGKCGGAVYCACQAKGSRGPAAATAPQLRQEALFTAPATQKGSAEAPYTAPARQKAAAGQRRPPRRSSARKLCHAKGKCGGSVYCACQAKGSSARKLCVLRLSE